MTYQLPKTDLRSTLVATYKSRQLPKSGNPVYHRDRIIYELRRLGVSRYGLMMMESHYLPRIIHLDEPVNAVVYGRHKDGFAMLVATDRRVIFLNKKPFFVNEDEITFGVVSGVQFSHAGFGSTVTLHTRIKDYSLKTLNRKCAEEFVEYIEARCLEHNYEGGLL